MFGMLGCAVGVRGCWTFGQYYLSRCMFWAWENLIISDTSVELGTVLRKISKYQLKSLQLIKDLSEINIGFEGSS
jgi:hypothetical protein